jgi:hypothetical protein
VKETAVVRARWKTRIVRRLDFGPVVEIQARDSRSREIDVRWEVPVLLPVAGPPEPPEVPGDPDPDPTPTPISSGEDDWGTEGGEGAETFTGGDEIGSLGVGSVGSGSTGGGGNVTVGVGTVGVGRVGVGRVGRPSASATPAETPSTTSTEARAADLIAEITSNAPFRVRGPPKSPMCLR